MRVKLYVLLLALLCACANVSAEQEFEQSVRSYETALKAGAAWYDPDGDGLVDREVSEAERKAVTTIVVSGRNIRDAGIDVVLECKAERLANPDIKECSKSKIILGSAEALTAIAIGLTDLYIDEE